MTERFDISRRKALAALGTIGVASAGAGLGTSAYFSDQETFENNQLVAGTLDMGVGYTAHYSDWSPDEGQGVDVMMYDGAAGETGSAGEVPGGYTGLPANDAWLIAVDDPDQFLDNTMTGAYPNVGTSDDPEQGPVECDDEGPGAATQADDAPKPVIELDDVKPGDFGEVTFDFILCDNPGYVWVNGQVQSASENGVTEPEADDPDEQDGVVELLDTLMAAVWVDDGNNYQNGDEVPIAIGSLRDILGMDGPLTTNGSNGTALNGNITASEGGGTGSQGCFSAGDVHSIAFAWWLPLDHGNEVQSDTVTFDLGLYTEQCRHNDGSGMNNADFGNETDDDAEPPAQ
jgi:predicted ribosomally synthesized peptide with SipW-like signal peptide